MIPTIDSVYYKAALPITLKPLRSKISIKSAQSYSPSHTVQVTTSSHVDPKVPIYDWLYIASTMPFHTSSSTYAAHRSINKYAIVLSLTILLSTVTILWAVILITHSTTTRKCSICKSAHPNPSQDSSQKSLSAYMQHQLSTSRIADYLENPTASHVQMQHSSSQQSIQVLAKKKSCIQELDAILSNNEK
jgi:hypothetical protein